MARTLTARQQRFVAEYAIDLNATQAAIRAGYSSHTAYSQGQRLLKHVEIAPAIQQTHVEVTAIVAERVGEAAGSAAWIVEKACEVVLRALAAVPLKDAKGKVLLDEEGNPVMGDGNLSAATPALVLLAKRWPEFSPKGDEAGGDTHQHLHLHGLSDDQLRAIAQRGLGDGSR
jgi:hypothetical protein